MSKHTPGPWSLTSFDGTRMAEVRVDGKLACLLHSFSRNSTLEDEANARLIAAAPDLLEALEDLIDLCKCAMQTANGDIGEYDIDGELKQARKAIAKARGQL